MSQGSKEYNGNTYLVSIAEKRTAKPLTPNTYLVTLTPNAYPTCLGDVMRDDFGFKLDGRTNYVDHVLLDDEENPYTWMLDCKSLSVIQEKAKQTCVDFIVSSAFDKPVLDYIYNCTKLDEVWAICNEVIGKYAEARRIREWMTGKGYPFKDVPSIIEDHLKGKHA